MMSWKVGARALAESFVSSLLLLPYIPCPASGLNSRKGDPGSSTASMRSRGSHLPRARWRATATAPPPAAAFWCRAATSAQAASMAAALAVKAGEPAWTPWAPSTSAASSRAKAAEGEGAASAVDAKRRAAVVAEETPPARADAVTATARRRGRWSISVDERVRCVTCACGAGRQASGDSSLLQKAGVHAGLEPFRAGNWNYTPQTWGSPRHHPQHTHAPGASVLKAQNAACGCARVKRRVVEREPRP